MSKKKSRLMLTQEQAESTLREVNSKIGELGEYSCKIYDELNTIQTLFDRIRNKPIEKRVEYEKLKEIRLNWKLQAEKIDKDHKNATAQIAGKGAVGVGAGVAVAALGPTAAMGFATTFGVASTGTAISTLSGAAATNAALAWLGGGSLAIGGGGIAAGNAFLALAGPVGWTVAGVALVGSGFMFWKGKSEQKHLEDIFALISTRDVKSYELAIVEINERIKRITDECKKLNYAIKRTISFGLDYNLMSENQQYELGSYVNLMNSSTQLLVNPIIGLQPKYNMDNLNEYITFSNKNINEKLVPLIVYLCNLLFEIDLDKKDKILLWKSFKGNKKFLSSLELSKKDFEFSILETVTDALKHKYRLERN